MRISFVYSLTCFAKNRHLFSFLLPSRMQKESSVDIAMIGSRGITSNYGGIEKVLDEVCPRLGRLGHKVDVYSATGVRFEAGNLRSIPVKSFGGKHLENISRSALATLRALGRYDVIHFHAIGPGVL